MSPSASRDVYAPCLEVGGIVAIEEVVVGQVFKGRRTSLRAGSASQVFARSRTVSEDKDAGHGSEAAQASDMPSKSVGGRKLAGGFDSRPPPLPKAPSDVRRSAEPARGGRGKGAQSGPTAPRPPHKSFVCPSAQHRTSLPTSRPRTGQVFSRRPLEGEEEAAWFAPWDDRLRKSSTAYACLGRTVALIDQALRLGGASRPVRQ
jgi:hypothetical protein